MSRGAEDEGLVCILDYVESSPWDAARIPDGSRFEGVDIYGPAVFVLMGCCTFESCDFGTPLDSIEQMFIEVPEGRAMIWAVGVRDAVFVGCRLHLIGFAGPPEHLQSIKRSLFGEQWDHRAEDSPTRG